MANVEEWKRNIRLSFEVNMVPTDLAELLASYTLAEKEYKAAENRLKHRCKRSDCSSLLQSMARDRDDD